MRETGDGDDLARWIFLNRWDGGPIEGEKDDAEEGGGLLVRTRLELRMGINDEGRADNREKNPPARIGEILDKSKR